MFLLANKENLRKSLIINDHDYIRAKNSNLITGVVLAFAAIGSLIMYLGFTDAESKTTSMLYMLIAFNAFAWILIVDHIFELKFLKKLLKEQSSENLFDEDEWAKIQEAAQRQGVSDKAIQESMTQK